MNSHISIQKFYIHNSLLILFVLGVYQYPNGYVGEVVFDHENTIKLVRPVRAEPELPPYTAPDTLGQVLGDLLDAQVPKPWLTHPKGLTLGAKGALYTGERKGIKRGSVQAAGKLATAMEQLGQLPLREAGQKDWESLVVLCNQVADIVDSVNL